jgi:hypothetical protein
MPLWTTALMALVIEEQQRNLSFLETKYLNLDGTDRIYPRASLISTPN